MSAMFDYITGKKSGREAELEASLEHMGGYLGIEIEDNEKLRAEIERLAAESERLKGDIKFQVELEREACAQVALCIGEDAGNAVAAGIRLRAFVSSKLERK